METLGRREHGEERQSHDAAALIWHSIGFADETLASFAQGMWTSSCADSQRKPLVLTKCPLEDRVGSR